ncbi:DUF5686 and carboxypeptidase regulatory-like domain-containing protein [uncultured Cyclobacterium sp.]|uniref:DUF5686 and carboxypeptidase regulatory-like domain-containing protein n=1 Tax=uncultured Cyclobacterium sp. TaxID=453820 RepID=UPI0030ECBFB8|tara:strand:+ start:11573 stop:14233 length:2661 start_codon:yes stop_codon:yes gene_type:complete
MKKASICIFRITLLILVLAIIRAPSNAQGIKGIVSSEEGQPLAFATVFARNLNDGIPTNQDGYFEWKLPNGHYDILFQYLGYTAQLQTFEVKDDWIEVNVRLEMQTYGLNVVEVREGAEDPALTVIRKAIAKAKYHKLQVDAYSMMVYIKGTGELTDAPFFLKKKLAEEGIGLNEAYTSESVSKIEFKQPNEIKETVISIRSSGENNQTSPAPYIGASFYDEKVNEIISPLARSAFAYYKFRLEGTFIENEVLINKIRVIPRSKGERVFDGYIYIIEDLWAIHSLDLKTSLMGFDIRVRQQYAPVKERVWMPITHTYNFGGKFFGFAGEFQYLASTNDYELQLNPSLIFETEILDEKITDIPEDISKISTRESPIEKLEEADQLSRKQYRKLIATYEKEANKEREDKDILSIRSHIIDSLATSRNSAYWDSIRPVPLTNKEALGYVRDDSLALVEVAKNSEVDSIAQKAKRKFKAFDFLTGGRYNFGKGRSAGFYTNWTKMSFNTVEGFKVGFSGFYRKEEVSKLADSVTNHVKSWNLRPAFRYGFASEKAYMTLDFRRSITKGREGYSWGVDGGKYIYQYNANEPISEQVNAFYSLFLRENYMKLYEKTFAKLYWAHRMGDKFTYRTSLSIEERSPLTNHSDYSFFYTGKKEYSINQPFVSEGEGASFLASKGVLFDLNVDWRPGLKYQVRNDRKIPIMNSSPLIFMNYRQALPIIYNGEDVADFQQVELGLQHAIQFGVSGKLAFNLNAGTFLNKDKVYFMDYKHFGGNRTIFSNMGAASNYRFLDYYTFSTSDSYFGGLIHYQFRKFLLTQLPGLRFSGVRENIFFNYLTTNSSPHYWELGYSLDNLFRIFRLEVGAGFENRKYNSGGLRFGIATFISINLDE